MHEPNTPAIVIQIPTPLAEIAKQINAEHQGCERAVRQGLRHAVEAGKLLNAAKARVERGKWASWCRGNLSLSAATIYRYTRLATWWPTIVEHAGSEENADDMPILEACSLLKRGRPEREGEKRPALASHVDAVIEQYLAMDDALRGIGERLETAAAIIPAASWPGWLLVEFEMVPAIAEAYITAAKSEEPVAAWMNREPATSEPTASTFRYESLDPRPRDVVRKLAGEVFEGIAVVDNAVADVGTRLASARQSLVGTVGAEVVFDSWCCVEFDLNHADVSRFLVAANKPVVAEVPHIPQTPPATPTAAPEPTRRRRQSATPRAEEEAPDAAETPPTASPIQSRMAELIGLSQQRQLTAVEQQETVDLASQAETAAEAAESHTLLVNSVNRLRRMAAKGLRRCKELGESWPDLAEKIAIVKQQLQAVLDAIAQNLPAK